MTNISAFFVRHFSCWFGVVVLAPPRPLHSLLSFPLSLHCRTRDLDAAREKEERLRSRIKTLSNAKNASNNDSSSKKNSTGEKKSTRHKDKRRKRTASESKLASSEDDDDNSGRNADDDDYSDDDFVHGSGDDDGDDVASRAGRARGAGAQGRRRMVELEKRVEVRSETAARLLVHVHSTAINETCKNFGRHYPYFPLSLIFLFSAFAPSHLQGRGYAQN